VFFFSYIFIFSIAVLYLVGLGAHFKLIIKYDIINFCIKPCLFEILINSDVNSLYLVIILFGNVMFYRRVVEYLGSSIMGFGSIVIDEINITTLYIWKTFHCNPLEFPHLIILVYNDVF